MHGRLLQRKIGWAYPRLARASEAFWRHPSLADLYLDYLHSLHGLMRASVPLMEAALNRSHERAPSDPVAASLVDYFTRHIPEELGHDLWVLEDLEALGIDRAEAVRRIPSPGIAAAIGSQYYWIHHVHPIGLLGYVAVVEGNPPSPESLEEIVSGSGLPAEAFQTLFKHARLDPLHRDELFAFLDTLPLEPEDAALLGVSALSTVGALSAVFETLMRCEPTGASLAG